MNKAEANKLPHGIYQLFWKDGGSSYASVGSLANGMRWYAPCNWVGGMGNVDWRRVERAVLIKEQT